MKQNKAEHFVNNEICVTIHIVFMNIWRKNIYIAMKQNKAQHFVNNQICRLFLALQGNLCI